MKLLKLLPLAILSVISIGVHNFPAQAESSEWEQAQVGDGYTSSSEESCVPTMALSSGTDDCGNDLTTSSSDSSDSSDDSSCWDKMQDCLNKRDTQNDASGAGPVEREVENFGCAMDAISCGAGGFIKDVVGPLF